MEVQEDGSESHRFQAWGPTVDHQTPASPDIYYVTSNPRVLAFKDIKILDQQRLLPMCFLNRLAVGASRLNQYYGDSLLLEL